MDRETERPLPLLHRLIAAGRLRYWIIASWALALLVTVEWRLVVLWFCVTMISGLVRGMVDRRATFRSESTRARVRTAVATLSCVAWAAGPLLSVYGDHPNGLLMGVGLLMAGYTLVFTQMRAAPTEALIVSSPYTAALIATCVDRWEQPAFWVLVALTPAIGLAMLIKVVVTQLKDHELERVNRAQAALIEDLKIARDMANAASNAKSNFLGVMSHELRTPLNGVLGAAQLLGMSQMTGRQEEFVNIILKSGEGLMGLLNDVLDISKIEAGKLELSPAPIETAGLAEHLTGPFQAQAESRGLTFDCAVEGRLPERLMMDLPRVSQVVFNLLGNAVKFTREGGVRLRLRTLDLGGGRHSLSVAVSDTGIGIAEADIPRLFAAFSQVDASSTRGFGGTGLGLNICQRLAEMMGGEIAVASTPGAGSTFTLSAIFDEPPAALPAAA